MVASTTKNQLAGCLENVRFPADQNDLLTAAVHTGCDDDTIGALQGLEPRTYTNGKQVLASMSIVDESDIRGDGEETVGSRRSDTDPGDDSV